jgi:hypothetical protein
MTIPNEIKDLIERSGNSFHAKVARWLTDNGWHVIVSPYYMDQTQNKAREIDLIAEKAWQFYDPFNNPAGNIAVRLFIECKYVPSSAVFWFADKDIKAAKELVCSSGLFRNDNSYTDKHHYLSECPRVAKLFASSTNKAAENEPFYKALNQALNGMVSLRGQEISIPAERRPPNAVLELPVVVCNSFSPLYAANFDNDEEPQSIDDNFQLEVRYAYIDSYQNQRDDYFLLDFVEFDKLDKFMGLINIDAESAINLI